MLKQRDLLRVDPTRTATLRRQFVRDMRRHYGKLKRELIALIVEEEALGLVANKRWSFQESDAKVEAFKKWLKLTTGSPDIAKYIRAGYKKGVKRSLKDVGKLDPEAEATTLKNMLFRPVTEAKVKLLVSRTFSDLEGIDAAMGTKMVRALADGLVQGAHPREIAKRLTEVVDITRGRAETIARTEIVRAHAEGQLEALEEMGVTELGVSVEWSTAGGAGVCNRCSALAGTVFNVANARGKLPLHPNCRCAWVPSLPKELAKPKKLKKKTVAENGGMLEILCSPELHYLSTNVFCSTGKGGGVDPHCTTGGGSAAGAAEADKTVAAAIAVAKNTDHHAGIWGPKPNGPTSYGVVLTDGEGRILLRKPTGGFNGESWTFAKGGASPGEHPAEAAVKEAKEETGHYAVLGAAILGNHKEGKDYWNNFYYVAHSAGHDSALMDKETSETKWVKPSEAAELIKQGSNKNAIARDLGVLKAYREMSPEDQPKGIAAKPPEVKAPKVTGADVAKKLEGTGLTKGQLQKVGLINPSGPENGVLKVPKATSDDTVSAIEKLYPGVKVNKVDTSGMLKALNTAVQQPQSAVPVVEPLTSPVKKLVLPKSTEPLPGIVEPTVVEVPGMSPKQVAAAKKKKGLQPGEQATVTPGADYKEHGRQVIAQLDKQEVTALKYYTGFGYSQVNSDMRKCPPKFDCVKGSQKETMDLIQSALDKAPPLSKPMSVNRGLSLDSNKVVALVKTLEALKDTGVPYQMPCFTSTSVASGFGGNVRMRITAKTGLYVKSISKHKGEEEILCSPKAQYKITKIETKAYATVVHMEEL